MALLAHDDAPSLLPLAAAGGKGTTVRVFEHDPDLLDGVEDRIAGHLRRVALATCLTVERGRWTPPPEARRGLGLLVLDGLLVQSATLQGRCCPHLLGPGDLLRLDEQHDPSATIAASVRWETLGRARLALLDAGFARLVGPHPALLSALLGRAAQTARHLSMHLAIAHVPRAEDRLHLLLWHLADRFGRVGRDGVHVPLRLTHRLLGYLACVQRPTATTALVALADGGLVSRRWDGTWLLHGDPPAC